MENPTYNKRDNIIYREFTSNEACNIEKLVLTCFLGRVGGELGSVEERRLSYNALVNLYGEGRRESWERGCALVSKF